MYSFVYTFTYSFMYSFMYSKRVILRELIVASQSGGSHEVDRIS